MMIVAGNIVTHDSAATATTVTVFTSIGGSRVRGGCSTFGRYSGGQQGCMIIVIDMSTVRYTTTTAGATTSVKSQFS